MVWECTRRGIILKNGYGETMNFNGRIEPKNIFKTDKRKKESIKMKESEEKKKRNVIRRKNVKRIKKERELKNERGK